MALEQSQDAGPFKQVVRKETHDEGLAHNVDNPLAKGGEMKDYKRGKRWVEERMTLTYACEDVPWADLHPSPSV